MSSLVKPGVIGEVLAGGGPPALVRPAGRQINDLPTAPELRSSATRVAWRAHRYIFLLRSLHLFTSRSTFGNPTQLRHREYQLDVVFHCPHGHPIALR